MCIRQYPKNTQKPALQGRNKSTDRKVRTLFLQGDYALPNLKVQPEKEIEIGVWGQRYRRYLKQNHRIRYYNLLTAGTLGEHLTEVDQQAEQMFQSLVAALSKQENVTEKLKADNSMEWVRRMNNIRNRATEIVNSELIFI